MSKKLEIPTANDGPPWRCITIRAEDAAGPMWGALQWEYRHWQHVPLVERDVRIYWRKKDRQHTFIFSPNAAIEALRERLKGVRLKRIGRADLKKLEDDGFSWNGVAE